MADAPIDQPKKPTRITLEPETAAEMIVRRMQYMQQHLALIRATMQRYEGLKALDDELEKRGALDAVRSLLKSGE